ncbi:MAG: peptidylprolyl isomerase [Proteobacteria bacterium]|nr:peptidylprolyl isomerase [Pseudomonadota bacterium]
MKKISLFLTCLTLIFSTMNQASAQKSAIKTDPENTLYIDLKYGRVVIEMLPKVAPKHVERIKTLARQKFYDGIVFHRVIDGFMAQTGDPTGTGMGGSKLPDLKAEFSDEPHIRGAVSMARSSNPNSGNSQFFIVTKDSRFLDTQYTVWGRVVSGMEFVDQIKKGSGDSGKVTNPDAMLKVRVAVDVEKK